MKKYRFHVKAAMLGTLLLTFPACEGLFDDIYDNPSEANPSTNGFGFVGKKPRTMIWTGRRKSWARWRAENPTTASQTIGTMIPE